MVALSPSCHETSGRHPDVPTEPPWHPNTYLSPSASCLRYLTRVFPLPVPAHSSQAEGPRLSPLPRSRAHYSTCPERGREAGERPVCSVATSGCPTRSEDGFPVGARNIPPRPVQPKIKTPHHSVRGSGRAADGLEGGNPERARECISAWKRFPLQTRKKPRDEVRGFWSG